MNTDIKTRLEVLDAAIARGTADADAGRVKPADEVFDRLKAKYLAMAQKQDGGDSADATRHIVKPG
jgi:antitoxin ParD1/3/4